MSYSKVLICGSCDQPSTAHTRDDNVVLDMGGGFRIECPRSYDQIGLSSWYSPSGVEFSDYWLIDGQVTFPYDHSGTEAQSGSDLMLERIANDILLANDPEFDPSPATPLFGIGVDQEPYVPQDDPRSEVSKVSRWNDLTHRTSLQGDKSWVCTSLLGETDKSPEYVLTQAADGKRSKKPYDSADEVKREQRNAFVEDNPGFLSVELYSDLVTERYHNHLLNIFRDKHTNKLRVGSVKFLHYVDGTIQAQCVRNDCNGRSAVMNPETATREQMEEFVWAVIAHGNNHSAKWFREREFQGERQFYELSTVLSEPVLTDDEQYAFLKEHNRHCRDVKCECATRLRELRPDLHPHVPKKEKVNA